MPKAYCYESDTKEATLRFGFNESPTAGQKFSVAVTDVDSMVTLTWYVDDDVIRSIECPDPPCHDDVYLPGEIVAYKK